MRVPSEKIGRGFDHFIAALASIGGALVLGMMFLMVIEVVTRYFLKNPPTWALEVNSYIQFGMAFLGTAWLLKIRKHITVDVVIENINPKAQIWLNIITSILGALILITITIFSTLSTIDHAQRGALVWQVLRFQKFILLAFIPFGCFLTAVQFIRQAAYHIKSLKTYVPTAKRPKEVRWEEEVRL
jgi:C4-dicarboxylate transporter DctQ subunit